MGRTTLSGLRNIVLACIAPTLVTCGGGGGDSGTLPQGGTPATDDGTNRAPQAFDISLQVDGSVPAVEARLEGSDPDENTLSYVLDSPRSGPGYSLAFVEPDSGIVNIVLSADTPRSLSLTYRVSDGLLFSEPARLSVELGTLGGGALGAVPVDVDAYGAVEIAYPNGQSVGAGADGSGVGAGGLPASVDLSGNFPPPGDQDPLNSCVGWAVAYAVKSYQEKLEEQWEYANLSTLFSPSWIYNQLNGGVDEGIDPLRALQLIVDEGAATLATMPYDPADYRTQPGVEARSEAFAYKAREFRRVPSLDQIKQFLADRTPVVIVIKVYPSLENIKGRDAVYNDYSGTPERIQHAVTVVGYDDNIYGGAYKIINSWGRDWGNDGYFWLPMRFVNQIITAALVLYDAPNTGVDQPNVQPPQDTTLPNLTVSSFDVDYTGAAGGAGAWRWKVTNTGSSTARAGADVNLILTADRRIDSSDRTLVYEALPADLAPGEATSREEGNALPFNIPQDVPAGEYYLAVWVDDFNKVSESDETDNILFLENTISVSAPQLPDLVIDSWVVTGDASTGVGNLAYQVRNAGDVAVPGTTWDINLVLSTTENVKESLRYYLFYEDAASELAPGATLTRSQNSQASFSFFTDQDGRPIAPGSYYLSLWVDDQEEVGESREFNNLSTDNRLFALPPGTARHRDDDALEHRFNGIAMPTPQILARTRVEIRADDGMNPVMSEAVSSASGEAVVHFEYHLRSENQFIFPEVKVMPMSKPAEFSSVDEKSLVGM